MSKVERQYGCDRGHISNLPRHALEFVLPPILFLMLAAAIHADPSPSPSPIVVLEKSCPGCNAPYPAGATGEWMEHHAIAHQVVTVLQRMEARHAVVDGNEELRELVLGMARQTAQLAHQYPKSPLLPPLQESVKLIRDLVRRVERLEAEIAKESDP